MGHLTEKEQKGLQEAMEMAGIRHCMLFASYDTGKTIFFKQGDENFLQKLMGGLCRKHQDLTVWFLGVIKIASGAKYLNISIDEEGPKPPDPSGGAEA